MTAACCRSRRARGGSQSSARSPRMPIRSSAPGRRAALSRTGPRRRPPALPGDQQALADALLATGRPVVVLLMNGRPLAIDRLAQRAPAILETWFLGVEAGPAIADILTGRVDPGGRLPVSFPRASGAVPFPYD